MIAVGTGRLGAEYLNTGKLDSRLARFHHPTVRDRRDACPDGLLVVDAAGEMQGLAMLPTAP